MVRCPKPFFDLRASKQEQANLIYHILNGDAVAEKFPTTVEGQIIVIREAFMEGPVSTRYTNEYWTKRAEYISEAYTSTTEEYAEKFLSQLSLLQKIENGDDVFLWFEDDLFCQVNMWFSIHYIARFCQPQLYRVFPKEDKLLWRGFGDANSKELEQNYQTSIPFRTDDIELIIQLWEAYVNEDIAKLITLSNTKTGTIRYLPEVIQAHLERRPIDGKPGRPQKRLQQIIDSGMNSFPEIFLAFWKQEGIYGFGDRQVYNILKEMGYTYEEIKTL